MPVRESETPAEMQALQADPDRLAILMHQRDEEGFKRTITEKLARGDKTAADHIDALIQCLLVQGKHDETHQWAMETRHQRVIDTHRAAVEMDDDEVCDCPHEPTLEALTKHEVVTKSWSEKHQRVIHHFRCRYCGHTNARPTAPDVAHGLLEKGRAEAQRLFRVAGPFIDVRRISDDELLRQVKDATSNQVG